ncbi:hypothetical protein [Crossiella sp. CA198]|uniref:hypothetical protein n=1 Tax=Crossiella sp. CA198 TaxID=3455607 RepID=UPI003F8CFB66
MTTIAAAAAAPPPTARLEQAVQNAIMLAIAASAAASAFTHVRDLSMSYGLPEWQGWTNAVVVELMGAAAGLELRRRLRARQSIVFAAAVLAVAVLVSLACQVAEAHPSPWGWTLNAIPAVGLLAVTKLVLGRATVVPVPATVEVRAAADLVPVPDRSAHQAPVPGPLVPVRSGPAPAPRPEQDQPGRPVRTAVPVPAVAPDHGPGPADRTTRPDQRTADLVPGPPVRTPGPAYAATVQRTQVRATVDPDPRLALVEDLVRAWSPDRTPGRRDAAEAIRAAGHAVSNAAAGDLLRRALAKHTGGPQ